MPLSTGTAPEIHSDINRGKTWSICAAMTLDRYLPCTGLKEGYFNADDFLVWLKEKLLLEISQLRFEVFHGILIVMDNLSIHAKEEVRRVIEEAGHLVRYLPPYSPDYNPIELTFSVLKAWIKRYYHYMHPAFDDFGTFLTAAIEGSRCDRFVQ